MSKTTDDLIDRIVGTATALKGMKSKLSPEPVPAQVSVVTPAAPAPEIAMEDYAQTDKLAKELEGLAKDLDEEVKKESKVPENKPKSGGSAKG